MPSGRFDYRARHRQRAHEEAHADEDPGGELPVPEAVVAPRGAAALLGTDAEIAELIAHLRQSGSFAYDSEFIGESSYHPFLCLIQVATADRVALIDPLAGCDLMPFWELLCDASVEKIVHAGSQDVEPVVRFTGKGPANVLDTQIAAGFCGLAYPTSLQKLVQETTGVPLQKGFTFTHWDQRPLSAKQLRYAADDVRYLPAVATELKKRLAKTGHLKWALAECDAMCRPENYTFDVRSAVEKVRGAGALGARELNVLTELVVWRDNAAREANLPSRSFLRDEVMIDICRTMPKQAEKLQKVRGLPRPVIEAHAETIAALTIKALATNVEGVQLLSGSAPTPSEKFAADALFVAAQAICFAQSIDSAVVLARQDITDLHRRLTSGKAVDDLRLMPGRRREAVGEKLLAVYRGEATAEVRL